MATIAHSQVDSAACRPCIQSWAGAVCRCQLTLMLHLCCLSTAPQAEGWCLEAQVDPLYSITEALCWVHNACCPHVLVLTGCRRAETSLSCKLLMPEVQQTAQVSN